MADRIVSIGPGAGLYAAWQYQALITITNPVAQANFQHKLLLSWLPGMRSDFSDIRFTQTNGTDCLYWIRSDNVVAFGSCEVWINVPSASQSAILMFWGNGACNSGSSMSAAMDFGDDFDGSTINTSVWTASGSSVSGGICSLVSGGTGVYIQTKTAVSLNPGIVMYCAKSKHFQNTTYYEYCRSRYINDNNYSSEIFSYGDATRGKKFTNRASSTSSYSSISGWSADTYAVVTVKATGSSTIWDINGGSPVTDSSNVPANNGKIYFIADVAFSEWDIKWVATRKYAATEPVCTLTSTMPNPENNRYVWTDGNVAGDCSFGVNYALITKGDLTGLVPFGVNYALTVKGDLTAIVPFTVRYGFIADGRVVRPTQSSLVVGGSCSRNMATRMWTAKVKYAKAVTGGIGSALFDTNIEIYVPDHNGVSRCVFVGFYPSQTAQLAPGNDSEEFTGYDYAMKLSGRIIPDDLLSLLAPSKQSTANYQRLDYDSVVNNFTVGRTVEGLISGAMGKIVGTQSQWLYGTGGESYLVPMNSIILTDTSGTFQDNETLKEIGSAGQALVNGGAFIPLDFGPTLMYPEDWVRAILGGNNTWRSETGIYPYRINPSIPATTTWTPKPYDSWDFPEDITRDQGIQMLSEYHNFIFLVKWKDIGLGGQTPCAYWVHQDDIDNADAYALTEHRGLSLPAAATVNAADPYLVGNVRMTIAGEGKRNQVLIRCQDMDGTYFTNARSPGVTESAGVYYGQEIPNTYYRNDPNLVSQADCDAAAALLYAYMSLRTLTYTAVFAKRVDLEYLQKMTFSGLASRGIPDDTYRIIGITPSWADAAVFVEVTLIPDTQFKASMAINKIYTNSTIAVRNIVRDELAKIGKPELGTFTGYNSNAEAEVYTEKGVKMVMRDGSA